MDSTTERRVAVITGGASGIGRAATLRLLTDGMNVLFVDLNEASASQTLDLADQAGFGERVQFFHGNVADEDVVQNAMATAMRRWNRLDVAFLNAGIIGALGSITETTVAEWDATFAYLVRSVFLGIKHAATHMRPRRCGSIIATASASGLSAGGGGHAYSAAKAAVINLVKSASLELARDRIRVNCVAPGLISTPLVHGGKEEKFAQLLGRQPWPDSGMPEDIAGAVAYLASDDSHFMTGATMLLDGGLLANGANVWGKECPVFQGTGINLGTTGQGAKRKDSEA